MKNKIIIPIIILLQIFFISKVISEEIEFKATDIEIINDQSLTIANNGSALIKDDELIVEGKKMKYFRNESLLNWLDNLQATSSSISLSTRTEK